MLAAKSVHEDFWGAIPDWDTCTMFCSNCGEFIPDDEPYIEKYNGDVMCADCIETKTHEFILDYIGYDNIFDVLDKLGKLGYAG